MFERKITTEEVRKVVRNAEVVKKYSDDKPFPSYLLLGFLDKRPVHLVVAKENKFDKCIIITVYEPDKNIWKDDFKERRN